MDLDNYSPVCQKSPKSQYPTPLSCSKPQNSYFGIHLKLGTIVPSGTQPSLEEKKKNSAKTWDLQKTQQLRL